MVLLQISRKNVATINLYMYRHEQFGIIFMSLKFFILNPHLLPFILSFIIIILIIFITFKFRIRTKSVLVTAKDLKRYSNFERKILLASCLLLVFGLVGMIVMAERFGYYTTLKKADGTVVVEKIGGKPNRIGVDY